MEWGGSSLLSGFVASSLSDSLRSRCRGHLSSSAAMGDGLADSCRVIKEGIILKTLAGVNSDAKGTGWSWVQFTLGALIIQSRMKIA